MFETIDHLYRGTTKQNLAYKAIKDLGILHDLSEFHPILCGTLPIGIDIERSDLDVIMEAYHLDAFEKKLRHLYGEKDHFIVKRNTIRGVPVVKANFYYKEFEFELFGQPEPVTEQNAYLHMIIEHAIMLEIPGIKEGVIKLKQQGIKTEPAFCKKLGLEGDPYKRLIDFGRNKGYI
ncbi:protein of unknown function [Salinibacillus kushneri]|uniref:DUF4269 domain-containing protein n=1 Tax=Salinibacillus kushneri TaxID=237682 RepID=A0A1I0F520_9BACI|nr:DUF4269 domain-containing protein [Salinibacillus kushneri]SET52512.1 protein of unknown function [Salinibacillus kushneri]